MRSPSVAGSGSAAATTSRGATSAPRTRTGSVESRPSRCSVLRTPMNSSPRPYLNVTRRHSTWRGTSTTSSCSTFTHSTVPIPRGTRRPGLGERLGGVEAALTLPDQRRVQALLDRRPDRERGREPVALHRQVGPVADADLVDLGEQVVGRIAGEDVGEARLDAHAHEREQAGPLPLRGGGELLVAEHHAGLLEGPHRVTPRERHRHVEIRAAGLEGGLEDRRVQPRVARVEDHVGALGARELHESMLSDFPRIAARSPASRPAAAKRPSSRPATAAWARGIEIGQHHAVEEVPATGDGGRGGADAARSDDEDAHGAREATRRRTPRQLAAAPSAPARGTPDSGSAPWPGRAGW